jgi:hypothetical protein
MAMNKLLAIVFIVVPIICFWVKVHIQLLDYISQSTNHAWSCGPARVKYWCYLYSAAVFMKLLSTGWTTVFLFGIRSGHCLDRVAFRGNKSVRANVTENNTWITRNKDHLACLYRLHPVAYLQTILLCLYRLTQLKEFISFNLIYWYHMFRPFFSHHQVNTTVY